MVIWRYAPLTHPYSRMQTVFSLTRRWQNDWGSEVVCHNALFVLANCWVGQNHLHIAMCFRMRHGCLQLRNHRPFAEKAIFTFSTFGGLHVSVEDTKRFADPKLGDSLALLHPRRSQVSAPPPKPFLRLRIDVPVVAGIIVEFPRRLSWYQWYPWKSATKGIFW